LARMQEQMELRHFLIGMSKAPLFALVIGLIGCLEGLQVEGTAQSVGERTTSSVVQTISLAIVIDAIAAIWIMHMGWGWHRNPLPARKPANPHPRIRRWCAYAACARSSARRSFTKGWISMSAAARSSAWSVARARASRY